MARIPEETINRIKQDISLLRLVESQGLKVTRQGKDSVVSCPFHEDKTPSCVISPKANLFNCFGCGAGGSVIDWVMKTQGVSFRFACEILHLNPRVLNLQNSQEISLSALLGCRIAQTRVTGPDYYTREEWNN